MAMESDANRVVEAAINSIGLGFDLCSNLKPEYFKGFSQDSRLIAIDFDRVCSVELPGGIAIPNVPKSIKCVWCKEEDPKRVCSDVLSFQQMSEQFNQELALSGKIPTGHFNAAFEFSGAWHNDAANTKSLAFDGFSITLCDIAFDKTQVVLCDYVKQAVPLSWDPAALARFIEKYGTHVIVGLKIGGIDIIYVKQQYLSPLQPADVQKNLKYLVDTELKQSGWYNTRAWRSRGTEKVPDTIFMWKRKGGCGEKCTKHTEWCQTVFSQPDVISMSLMPITSLLSGTNRSRYLTHAINAYLQYKPPIKELHQFLEFQIPRRWAPVCGVLAFGPERKPGSTASSQISFVGPKLFVNTTPVDVSKKPVTGLRLYLEGKRSNCLAIHLQHLSSVPKTFQLQDELNGTVSGASDEHKYYEKVQLKGLSHVCTAPVEFDDHNTIVTGAHFEVGETGREKVLFLRLHFSRVVGVTQGKYPQWVRSPCWTQKSGRISTWISTRFSSPENPPPLPSDLLNSDLYPEGPTVPTVTPKLSRFVDTTEITRGPLDDPGYWVVSGARLVVEKDKLSLSVKYSLLSMILPD